ncbi:MAG: lactate utilization protein [Treponema sp.]|jgi:L-lactate utilization protein LutB|nr:lactate utilization protein [Treponema sp.]
MLGREESIIKKYELQGALTVKNLEGRHFEAYYCKDRKEAAEKALSLLTPGSSVSWGGSVTVEETGVTGMLYEKGFKVIDRDKAKTPEERLELMRQALLCDAFFAGINALSEDGVLINIDGTGNRVAPILFGPKSVILITGMNKVCKTPEDARARARTYAAPVNAQRIGAQNTPCALTGSCGDCKSPGCICSYIVEIRQSKPAGRIKVILVGEELGL